MKYYIAVNGAHQGPFEIAELGAHNITPQTLVWNETMSGWTHAGEVAEIADYYFARPAAPAVQEPAPAPAPEPYAAPAYDQQPAQGNYAGGYDQQSAGYAPEMPNTWLVPSILLLLCCCMPCGVVSLVYALKVESRYNCGLYDEALAASNTAKTWFIVGIVGGILFWIGYIALYATLLSSVMSGFGSNLGL